MGARVPVVWPRWCGGGAATTTALLLLLLAVAAAAAAEAQERRTAPDKVSLGLYKKLFEVKRKEQMNALKTLIELRDLQQQYKIIDIMLQGLFKVLEESRVILAAANVLPSGPIPDDAHRGTVRAFSHVVENVAFFGDVLLRFPRIVHSYVDGSAERLALVRWGLLFCNGTGVFADGTHAQLLGLVRRQDGSRAPFPIRAPLTAWSLYILSPGAQELGLIEKSPEYHNPFQLDEEKEEKRRKQEEKREKRKGPRITRSRSEL
ncbi:coiled-coil domain-containing protein 134-like [Lethenteron reissneri]|uniref:coiled-coil domain-containing protein 134-like n=1 Tax=Lethenteron reissneri TaxID=7753 RepID=UPI002AB6CB69|nr:coiled-coil domain-containing protein 134-like [Lethenteron reissneri]